MSGITANFVKFGAGDFLRFLENRKLLTVNTLETSRKTLTEKQTKS